MEMRLARREDLAALSMLWQECFGDESDYIDAFYRHRFEAIRVPVAVDEAGQIIGMIHMLPCTHEGRNAYYLYAVGMARAWRGRGVMRLLLSRLVDECARRSVGLLLSPVNERLNAYYEGYGFRYRAGAWQELWVREQLGDASSSVTWRTCNAKEYFALREACLPGRACVRFPLDAVEYALQENASCGGNALASTVGDCVLLRNEGAHLVLREACFATSDGAKERLAALMERYGAKSCEVRSPMQISDGARPLYNVMAHGAFLPNAFTYMNLLLD